jgi:hypothetical protein
MGLLTTAYLAWLLWPEAGFPVSSSPVSPYLLTAFVRTKPSLLTKIRAASEKNLRAKKSR